MVWIAMDKTMVYFDSIIKARETAVKMIENNPHKYRNGGVMIYATKNGTPCWTDKKGNITHRISKDGSIRKV